MTTTKHVEDVDRGWKRIVRDMTKGAKADLVVDVGLVGSEAAEPHGELGELTNADVGLFHEYGTDTGIPERSFIRALVDEKHAQITRFFERISQGIIDDKVSEERGLGLAGTQVVAWIKARILAHIPPPLTEETIELKTVGGKKGTTPLIDTGQLIGAITHAVRSGREGERT
jgi:hypothetical protein